MKDMVDQLPGLERVRERFLTMLAERKERIATHALGAWEGETLEEVNGNLASAQAILHQIAGTAGSLGFAPLGQSAHACENEIIAHLEGPDADLAICPGELIFFLDNFVGACDALLESRD
ncbi:Hpt domain-containing protein [Marimonas sp. MJW-29]|uniref:Hpt domain-containing protein n=1 Tax=Sulfitobacter sediminis TaxID=3234186 RepID=A0ABV3RJT5_9RHOB